MFFYFQGERRRLAEYPNARHLLGKWREWVRRVVNGESTRRLQACLLCSWEIDAADSTLVLLSEKPFVDWGEKKKNLCVNFAVERKQTSETGWKYCCLLSNRIGAAEEITCSSAMQLERKGGYWKFASNTKHSIWIKYKITIKTKVFLLFITVRIILDANNPTISEHLEQSTGHNTDRLQSESSSNLQLHTTPQLLLYRQTKIAVTTDWK